MKKAVGESNVMQLSILPVKEYNVSKDSKEKETVSDSFLSYLQGLQKNSEEKKGAELTNVATLSHNSASVSLKTDQNAAETLADGTEKKGGLQSLVKNQAVMNGLHTALDLSQNVGQTSTVMNPIETVVEQKQGSSVLVEKSFGLHLQSRVIKQTVHATNMMQREENPVFQQLSQTITTGFMASKKMDMNLIDSRKINSLQSNENNLGKIPSDINKVNVDSLLHKQITLRGFLALSSQNVKPISGSSDMMQQMKNIISEVSSEQAMVNSEIVLENQVSPSNGVMTAPLQSQTGTKELNKVLDDIPNVIEQSPIMISKGKMIENQLETTLPIGLNSQISARKPNAGEMMQQAATIDFEKESQKVTTDAMPNQEIRINKQMSGIVNSLVLSERSTGKIQAESNMVNSEDVIQKQISPSEIAVTSSPLSIRTALSKTEQRFRDATDVNHKIPMVEITQSPAERVNPINQLNVLMQNSQNATKSKENNDISNNSSPNPDQVGSSNQVVNNGITLPNVQITKSFDSSVTPSIPSTVSVFAQDFVSTFLPRMHVAGTPEKMEATLSLNPEHLGAVDVKVVIQDGHVSAKLITDSSIGRATLEQHVDSLYAALQQQGLQVDKINITQHSSSSLPSAFSQGGDSAPKQGYQQSRRRGDSYSETEEYSDAPYESEWVSQINMMA